MVGINVPSRYRCLLLVRRLEGFAVRRHAHLRARGGELLHPRQGRHLALARPGHVEGRPRLPADALGGKRRDRAARARRAVRPARGGPRRGRTEVFVGGEAGVGKTALVRAFTAGQGGRLLHGACEGLTTPDAARAVPRRRRRRPRRASRGAARARARAGELGAPRRCSSSRTCTGRTRRPSTSSGSSAAASRPRPPLVLATYRDDEVDAEHPLRARARRPRRRRPRSRGDACRGSPSTRCAGSRRPLWGRRGDLRG